MRVNGQSLVTNFRGIKKKPGTAPPADITALSKRGTAGLFNQIEMVYVNSAQAVAGKVSRSGRKGWMGTVLTFCSEATTAAKILPGC